MFNDFLKDECLAGTPLSAEQKAVIQQWEKEIGAEVARCFQDGEFLKIFQENIPATEQLNYVRNTGRGCGYRKSKDFDPKYSLYFRRSIVGEQPKPEVFWTEDFWVAFNGLTKELPRTSPRRIYSEVLVATEDVLLNQYKISNAEYEVLKIKYGSGSSDGEIRISYKPFDINQDCLFTYKPEKEKQTYLEYKNLPNALTKAEVLQKIAEIHTQKDAEIQK